MIEAIEGKGGDGSEIRIRTIRATGPCDLGFLRRDELTELMATFPELSIRLNQFRQVGKKMSMKGANLNKLHAMQAEAKRAETVRASGGVVAVDDLSTLSGLSAKMMELNSQRMADLAKVTGTVV